MKAVVFASSMALCLLVMELAVRLVLPQQLIAIRSDIWEPHDGLGWVVRPGIDTTINTGERTVRVRTDRDGFRVGEAGRKTGDCEILLLGDSFMQALQVEHEQSLAGLIEARLPARLGGTTVAVRNAGVDGWDPNQYLLRAQERLRADGPDLILVGFYLGNDMIRSARIHVPPRPPTTVHELRWPRSLDWRGVVEAVFYPLNDWLEVRSHLFILVKTRLRGLLIQLGLSADYVPFGVRLAEMDDPMWTATVGVLGNLAASAAEHDVPVLYVLIPAPFAIDEAVFDQIVQGFDIEPDQLSPHQPERRIAGLLEQAELPFVSLRPGFARAHAEGEALYGRVDRHLSPAGHDVAYSEIEGTLVGAASVCAPAE